VRKPHFFAAATPSLWILILMTSVGPFGDTEYTPSLPRIADDLHTSYAAVQQSMTVYLASYALMQLLYGPLSDRFGRKPIVLLGALLFTLGSLLCYQSLSLDMLLLGRFIQGLGACAGAIISSAAVRDSYPKEQIDTVYAKINAAFALSPATGPIVGALVDDKFGWHANMLILFVLGILFFGALLFFFSETHLPDKRQHLDVTSVLHTYKKLFSQPNFFPSIFINAVAIGAVYTSLTEGPALVTKTFALSSSWFAVVALLVLSAFSIGSLLCIWLEKHISSLKIIPIGLAFIISGGIGLLFIYITHFLFFSIVMLAIMITYVGIALVVPSALGIAMRPFSYIAGAASAMAGFAQMFVASLANGGVSLLPNGPIYALGIAFSILGLLGFAAYRLKLYPLL
jgi:MFS transporter, DHA1 family, multidrug resistance protein